MAVRMDGGRAARRALRGAGGRFCIEARPGAGARFRAELRDGSGPDGAGLSESARRLARGIAGAAPGRVGARVRPVYSCGSASTSRSMRKGRFRAFTGFTAGASSTACPSRMKGRASALRRKWARWWSPWITASRRSIPILRRSRTATRGSNGSLPMRESSAWTTAASPWRARPPGAISARR